MTEEFILYITSKALQLTLMLALPMLLAALVTGLVISILQATTQIQEQTISFVPKILIVLVVVLLFGAWMFGSMQQFALEIFRLIPRMVR